MKKIITALDKYYILVLIAVFAALYFITGLRLCAVQSGSMEPNIPTWSLCIVNSHADYDDIEVGDVVVYVRRSDGKRIIHRVIEITEEGMITKGDANGRDDGVSVFRDNLFGKNLFHIPYLGKIPNLVRTPAGICVVVLLLAALVYTEVKDTKKTKTTKTTGKRSKPCTSISAPTPLYRNGRCWPSLTWTIPASPI